IWFRHASVELLRRQHRSQGFWPGNNHTVSSSYALLYLSSGITPSVINSVRLHSPQQLDEQNLHRQSIWNLNEQFLNGTAHTRFHRPHEFDLTTMGYNDQIPEPFLDAPV